MVLLFLGLEKHLRNLYSEDSETDPYLAMHIAINKMEEIPFKDADVENYVL